MSRQRTQTNGNGQALERYLDGLMTPEERAQFEREFDPAALRTETARQRMLDDSLHRLFAAPSVDDILARAAREHETRHQSIKPRRRPQRRLAIAAAVVLLISGARLWWFANPAPPGGPSVPRPQMTIDEAYQAIVDEGFEPDWVCETDEEFADAFRQRVHQPMLLTQLPPSVKAIGLGYRNVISTYTITLLARVDGEPVVVYIDQFRRQRDEPQTNMPGFRLFRRELGALVLYELTPHDQPHLLEHLYVPNPNP